MCHASCSEKERLDSLVIRIGHNVYGPDSADADTQTDPEFSSDGVNDLPDPVDKGSTLVVLHLCTFVGHKHRDLVGHHRSDRAVKCVLEGVADLLVITEHPDTAAGSVRHVTSFLIVTADDDHHERMIRFDIEE